MVRVERGCEQRRLEATGLLLKIEETGCWCDASEFLIRKLVGEGGLRKSVDGALISVSSDVLAAKSGVVSREHDRRNRVGERARGELVVLEVDFHDVGRNVALREVVGNLDDFRERGRSYRHRTSGVEVRANVAHTVVDLFPDESYRFVSKGDCFVYGRTYWR